MSRSGYSDDCDGWSLIRWRGAVASGLRGKRGQEFLKEALAALDAMPVKRLITDELKAEGSYCTLGVVGEARGMDMDAIDPYNAADVSAKLGISFAMAKEIVYLNDEGWYDETPEHRWRRMREWVASNIRPDAKTPTAQVGGQ